MTARILIDLLSFTGSRGGTETYVREIVRRLPGELPGTEFVAIANRAGADEVRSFFPGMVRTLSWVGPDRVTWALGALFGVDRAARAARADVLWCPANFGPIRRGVPRIVTVHDAIYHEARGGVVTRTVSAVTSWLMARSAATADEVITVSHAAARTIVARMGVASDRIVVVPNGASAGRAPADPWDAVAPLGIGPTRPVALSTGNRLPHKNFAGLLRAVAAMDPSARPLTVITGGPPADPLTPLVDELGLGNDVVLPGWVTADELEALYAVASVYVCPSLAEGFGLPVADALRRGVPVVANDIDVLREVGGTSAVYADAGDPSALADAIDGVLQAPADPDRRDEAVAWASAFTWENAAAGTAAVLRAALDATRSGWTT